MLVVHSFIHEAQLAIDIWQQNIERVGIHVRFEITHKVRHVVADGSNDCAAILAQHISITELATGCSNAGAIIQNRGDVVHGIFADRQPNHPEILDEVTYILTGGNDGNENLFTIAFFDVFDEIDSTGEHFVIGARIFGSEHSVKIHDHGLVRIVLTLDHQLRDRHFRKRKALRQVPAIRFL